LHNVIVNVYLSRDSVCAGDDSDAPHPKQIVVADGASIEDILSGVSRSGYLPSIAGGRATWSASSNVPLGVLAQEWEKPKLFFPDFEDLLDVDDKTLRIHFSYHTQIDPDIVYEVLNQLTLKAF
jgi:hypothetical protein